MFVQQKRTYFKQNNDFDLYAFLKVPKSIIATLFIICFISVLCLYSGAGGSFYPWAIKQIGFILFAFVSFFLLVCIKTSVIVRYTKPFFICSVLLLLVATFFGRRTLGASRWIDIGFIKIQPSELIKIAIVLVVAKFFGKINTTKLNTFFSLSKISAIAMLVLSIIFLQPDLATCIIIVATFITMLFAVGLPIKYAIIALLSSLLFCPIIWFKFLKEYQKLRVINFLFPENDPLGSGYNIIQSKIAIGSGGFIGKGFLAGTQGRLKFLPEHHTDFIFTSIGEEFGFIGCVIVLLLYLYLILYGLNVVRRINSVFGKLVCIGCSSLLFFHVFVNVGMVCGILPVAGIPLMMLSYGGSSLLLGVICMALIVNIDIHERVL